MNAHYFWVALALLLLAACGDREQASTPMSGAELYVNNCAACHGDRGEGDGPAAAALAVQVPNLRTLAERNGGTFPVDAVRAYIDGRDTPSAHGSRLMPVWGDEFTAAGDDEAEVERKISATVEFLETLQY